MLTNTVLSYGKYYAGINRTIGPYTFRILINVLFVDSDGWYKMGLCNILTCHQVRVIHIAAMNCFCIWKYILFQENEEWLMSSFIQLICELTTTEKEKKLGWLNGASGHESLSKHCC